MKPYRNLAEGILALVESSYMDEKTIDGVIKIMAKALKDIKNNQWKIKVQKGIDIIKKIRQYEEINGSQENIDQLLENI